ncbi:MAG: rRNA (adenine2503-C2)-methyltransferase [Acidimicrobiia bacterium]|jgi:23S rRNA (adenine2503-C2)-methyltransferase|nr:rRNA (adenine2503-C2)-methyltransferase [Acidimicrobiia bacterium]
MSPTQTRPAQTRPAQTRPTLYDLDQEGLGHLLEGQPAYRIRQVWDGLYRQARLPDDMTDLPKGLRARLAEAAPVALHPAAESATDNGDTVKTLWTLGDGARVESVLMHYPRRTTVCVSSQAGCAMACGFCATGQAGFQRHLTSGEIVEQVMRAIRRARPRRLDNVVLMGMGEPLANYDRVWAALRRLHDHAGLGARHLTVSTVGVVPGIRRMTTEPEPINLAVSLHAANDRLRDELVPLNRRYPLDELMAACRQYLDAKGRRLSFEWALIDGVNDRPSDAAELAERARPLGAHVNLIPLNPTPGWPTRGTPAAGVAQFAERLAHLGVNATVRRNRGTEIAAACGQLAADAPVELSARER